MSNFFAFATKNSWDEDVFQLTTGGILTIVALIVILIAAALFIHSRKGSHKLSTKQLVFSAVAMALGTVTSMIKLFHLPMGGSITLFSMLFIVRSGSRYYDFCCLRTFTVRHRSGLLFHSTVAGRLSSGFWCIGIIRFLP